MEYNLNSSALNFAGSHPNYALHINHQPNENRINLPEESTNDHDRPQKNTTMRTIMYYIIEKRSR